VGRHLDPHGGRGGRRVSAFQQKEKIAASDRDGQREGKRSKADRPGKKNCQVRDEERKFAVTERLNRLNGEAPFGKGREKSGSERLGRHG